MQKRTIMIFIITGLFLIILRTGVALSEGNLWQQANGPYGGTVYSLAINSNDELFAGTDVNIYRSTDNGNHWIRVRKCPPNQYAYNYFKTLAINASGHIFAGTAWDGILRSTDNGDTWTEMNNGLPYSALINALAFNSLGHLFIGTYEGVYCSTDNGENWTAVNNGLTDLEIESLAINSEDDLFAGTSDDNWGGSIFRSTDNGNNWSEINAGLPDDEVSALAINSSDYLFAAIQNSIFRSTDKGNNWTEVNDNIRCETLTISSNDDIFAGSFWYGIFLSTNNGTSWTNIGDDLPQIGVNALAVNSNGHVYAGMGNLGETGGIFCSTNNGGNWAEVSTGLTNIFIEKFVFNASGDVFAAATRGVFRSPDHGVRWTKINDGVQTLAMNSQGHLFAGTWADGVLLSTDNGNHWTEVSNGLGDEYDNFPGIIALAINSNGHLFAGTDDSFSGSIYRSTDQGANWVEVDSGLVKDEITCLAINSSDHIFVGMADGTIFRSMNNGDHWTKIANFYYDDILSLAIAPNGNIFAGVEDNGICCSTNNGDDWSNILGSEDYDYLPIAINSLGHVYICAEAEGVFRSMDNGATWQEYNTGLTEMDVRSLAFDPSGRLYAGTFGGGIFLSSESTTSVEEISGTPPITFSLEQNYPNPFNPLTNIQYHLNRSGHVELSVYNPLGQEITKLVEGYQAAGNYSVVWDGTDQSNHPMPSGVYVYRINTGASTQTKKMILLR